MTEYIYLLESLASKEGTTYGYLRGKVHELNTKGKPMEWRDYKFVKAGAQWLAVHKDSDVEIL